MQEKADKKPSSEPSAEVRKRPRRPSLVVMPVVAFAAIALLFALALSKGDPSKLPSALIGKPAPAVTLAPVPGILRDGQPVPGFSTVTNLGKGAPAIVNFWASWCAPCVEEHPLLVELERRTGVQVIGINHKDQPDNAKRFLDRLGNPFVASKQVPEDRIKILRAAFDRMIEDPELKALSDEALEGLLRTPTALPRFLGPALHRPALLEFLVFNRAKDMPREFWPGLVDHPDPEVRKLVARSPGAASVLTEEQFRRLLGDPNEDVRYQAEGNANAPRHLLDLLSKGRQGAELDDEEAEALSRIGAVGRALALGHPDTPGETLHRLAEALVAHTQAEADAEPEPQEARPEDRPGEVAKLLDCQTICAPRPAQEAVAFGLTHLGDWMAERRAAMRERVEAGRRVFEDEPGGFRLGASGAFFAYVRHPHADLDSTTVARRLLAEQGVLCIPGTAFGNDQERWLRLAFGNVEAEVIPEVGRRFADGGWA